MSEIAELHSKLTVVTEERDDLREKFEQLEIVVKELSTRLEAKDRELKEHIITDSTCNGKNGSDLSTLTGNEYETLKQAITDLIARNEEKDRKIEELRKAVITYQKVEEIILTSHLSAGRRRSTDTLHSCVTSSPNVAARSDPAVADLPQSHAVVGPPAGRANLSAQRSNSYDASKFNRIGGSKDATGDDRRKVSCTSLPRDYGNRLDMPADRISKPDDVFDMCTEDDDFHKEPKRKKGLKRFFARMRRSTSQEVVTNDKPFKRGGVRATAGPRLGGYRISNAKFEPAKSDSFLRPFAEWTADQVLSWLHDMGLSMYVNDCRKWSRTGQHMLDVSRHELEKELKMSNVLHKKKLRLALQSIKNGDRKEHVLLGGLRSNSIARWLDDIGLPQYKDQFYDARIDGRMLNHLTVDDLLHMKINNAVHHMSIRRGIEVLRSHNFNLGTLKRRPSLVRSLNSGSATINGSLVSPSDRLDSDVTLWTNHRVMEWLRMIDLSEYAANLRGSGVHGGLIMLEARFTVDHLANILIIPTSKTLLRRHLSGHFVNLVGQLVQTKKREMEQNPAMLLTLNMKVKPRKTIPFRKARGTSGYICPMEKVDPAEPPSKLSPEDERVQSAVASYKKELSKRESKPDVKTKPK